jgi:hypothetical protein
MNPLKKGPEMKVPSWLKLPKRLPGRDRMPKVKSAPKVKGMPKIKGVANVKMPAMVSDVYRDLKERRLLPLVAVLLVAIVAVPIALAESAEPVEESPPTPSVAAGGAKDAKVVAVSKDAPGLRDYRVRLADRTPKNPFEAPDSGSKEEGEGGGEESSGEAGSVESAPEESTPGEPVETESSGSTENHPATSEVRYFSYEIDVRVTPVSASGRPSKAKPSVRSNLPELTALPGKKTPALTFMQPSADGEKALMLVNPNVEAIFGEGVCASGGETCQLLALKKGLPETVVYGGNERIFRIELIGVHLVQVKSLTGGKQGSTPEELGAGPHPHGAG